MDDNDPPGERNDCKLLKYGAGRHAVIRLPDGRRVAITVGANVIEMCQTRGFFDLFFNVKPIGSWEVTHLYDVKRNGARLPFETVNAVALNILIERVCGCQTLHDVRVKEATGALDLVAEVEHRLDALSKQATAMAAEVRAS